MSTFSENSQKLVSDGFGLEQYSSLNNAQYLHWMENVLERLNVDVHIEKQQLDEARNLNNYLMRNGDISKGEFNRIDMSRLMEDKSVPTEISRILLDSVKTFDDVLLQKYMGNDTAMNQGMSQFRGIALVNLHKTDAELIAQFKLWLRLERKARSIVPVRAPSKAKLKKLHQHQVLPYLDILQWCVINDLEFTNGQIGELLFPEHREGNHAELVRKNTKPHLSYIFKLGIVSSI